MALANYTLGYIYQRFCKAMCDEKVQDKKEYEKYLVGDESDYVQ